MLTNQFSSFLSFSDSSIIFLLFHLFLNSHPLIMHFSHQILPFIRHLKCVLIFWQPFSFSSLRFHWKFFFCLIFRVFIIELNLWNILGFRKSRIVYFCFITLLDFKCFFVFLWTFLFVSVVSFFLSFFRFVLGVTFFSYFHIFKIHQQFISFVCTQGFFQ